MRRLFFICMVLCKFVIFAVTPTGAMELQIQPRVEAGIMLYSFELSASHESSLPANDNTTSNNFTQAKMKFDDTMWFASGGATVFLNRFYLDLSLRSAFDGEDQTRLTWSSYNEDTNDGRSRYLAMDSEMNGTFDKSDAAVSLGFSITERLSLYLGYKWSTLDVDTTFQGPYSDYGVEDYIAIGIVGGNEHLQFEYEGPFIGIIHGWQIDWSPSYSGLVSVNIGLAALDSTVEFNRSINTRLDSVNGTEIEQPTKTYTTNTFKHTGDTLGITFSVGWHGTCGENLNYTLAVSTYRYNFDMDQPTFDSTTESSVLFRAGLSYSF